MRKPTEIKVFFLKHGYLLIAAAWLITLAFLANNYWRYYSSPKGVQRSLQQNISQREKEFYALTTDTALMQKFLNREYAARDLEAFTGPGQDFYLFFYKGDWETCWTTDQIAFEQRDIPPPGAGPVFRKLQSGYYALIRQSLGSGGTDYVLGLLPVKEEYYVTNPYLPNQYYQLPRISNHYVIDTAGYGLPIYSRDGQKLFSVQYERGTEDNAPGWLSGVFFALAIICVFIFINLMAVYIGEKTKKWWGLVFLGVFLFVIRVISWFGPFPFDYSHYLLFDATVYASNLVLRSLGDLLIDVSLAAWIILYVRTQLSEEMRVPPMSQPRRYAAMFVLGISVYYASLLVATIIQGLVINSKISFDVTDLFSLNAFSIVGFIILGLLAFCFFFFSLIINDLLDQLSEDQHNLKYTVFGITGIIWLIIELFQSPQGYVIGIMIWAIFYFYVLDLSREKLGRNLHLPQFILWLLILTGSVTALLVQFNNQREMGGRMQLAVKLSNQTDPTLEFNLGMLDTAVVRDSQLIAYYRDPSHQDIAYLSHHLRNTYFFNFQNKYDLHFYYFDNAGGVMGSTDTINRKAAIDQMLLHESEPTSVADLFYHEISFVDFSYIARLRLWAPYADSSLGYFYYQMKPKAIKQEALYPKLLMKSEDNQFRNKLNAYSYAVYDHLKLVYNRNDYPFPLDLTMKDVPLGEFRFTTSPGYSLLWYKPEKGKLVVVARHSRMFLEAITLFAYMFCIFLLLILIFRIARFLVRSRMKPRALKEFFSFSMRTRVHAIIIFIVVFVFIILAFSTISFFIRRYDAQHREQLSSGMSVLLTGIQRAFQDYRTFNESGTMEDPVFQAGLRQRIQDISDTHGVDINIYDLDGNLRISTQNLIYENGLLSSKMDPSAYYKLMYLHHVQVIQKEQVGNLQFLSSYAAVRDDQGHTLAFFNQPYFASQVDLKEEISNFLVTLINLNAFIFLLSGLLALLLTNSITRSFTLIGEKLKEVNLSGTNEKILWNRDDEIGRLVREYNKMVEKLSISAESLARSEREGAWREMARQVAHEIKNPLTPMKLSLQHLQRAIDQDAPRTRKLTREVSRTLIEQIEHLSQIASDFSAFANITYASNEAVALTEVLQTVTTLHNGYEEVSVEYRKPGSPIYVWADKTQLNRLFTNLVLNAMQSIGEGTSGRVEVSTDTSEQEVTVAVADNGAGIADDVRSRIFTPNFTTKSSGTGLGLAMCKTIVEQMQGKIWFETEEGAGTTFFVRLPLLDSDASDEPDDGTTPAAA